MVRDRLGYNWGNAGLTKGGTGDTLAGIIVGLLTKNEPILAAVAGSLIIKKTAEYLHDQVGFNFSADDVAENVFKVWKKLLGEN
jgi:NAD(P)H-hydrate epimerase